MRGIKMFDEKGNPTVDMDLAFFIKANTSNAAKKLYRRYSGEGTLPWSDEAECQSGFWAYDNESETWFELNTATLNIILNTITAEPPKKDMTVKEMKKHLMSFNEDLKIRIESDEIDEDILLIPTKISQFDDMVIIHAE